MDRVVVLSCSRRKNPTPSLLPAVERYDGPLFRVLRRHYDGDKTNAPHLLVISGEYGLVRANTPLPLYDRLLTPQRAAELRSLLPSIFRAETEGFSMSEVFVSVSGLYFDAMSDCLKQVPKAVRVVFAEGSIGGRASQLSHWLGRSQTLPEQSNRTTLTGEATLLGTTIRLEPYEVFCIAKKALAEDANAASRFQTWFVDLENQRVAPKWLVGILFEKPVAKFRTADALRVLMRLGIPVERLSRHVYSPEEKYDRDIINRHGRIG